MPPDGFGRRQAARQGLVALDSIREPAAIAGVVLIVWRLRHKL
jgi:hypothetical protein